MNDPSAAMPDHSDTRAISKTLPQPPGPGAAGRLRRLYDRVLRLAASPRAELWLVLVSFAESSFFPVPPDALLIPMVVARPRRAVRYALLCTAASVAGGAFGYYIGYALFASVAEPVIRFYGYGPAVERFRDGYAQYGAAIILLKGLTPIPYKIVTITSGFARFDFGVFLLASAATRGLRFFLEALLLRRYGEPVRLFIERRLGLVTWASLGVIVLGFALLKLL